MTRTYIIAEIGLNHNGDINTALDMIDVAKLCGADAVKFQFFIKKEVEEVWDKVKDLQLSIGELRELRQYCKEEKGIDFLCSVFGMDSARHITHYMPDLNSIKIPSGQLPNTELRRFCEDHFEKVYCSTGMHNIEELFSYQLPRHWTIMHCVSAYPTPIYDVNLASISYLGRFFPNVGYSDHSPSKQTVSHLAVAAGAKVIERHFNIWGNQCVDNSVSDTPFYFRKMCERIRTIDMMLGEREKVCRQIEEVNLHRKFNQV